MAAERRLAIVRVFHLLGRATRKIAVAPREAALRARMALWVVLISALARVTSLSRAQWMATRGTGRRSGRRSATPAELGAAIDSVLGMELFVFRRSCWKRAMVLQRFLLLEGIDAKVNFGVQRGADGTVLGHAWLEHDGRALLEREAGSYVVTFTLPLTAASGSERSAG